MNYISKYRKFLKWEFILLLFTLLIASSFEISYSSSGHSSSGTSSSGTSSNKATLNKVEFFKPVIDKLLLKGVDSSFIFGLVEHKNTKFDEKYVKINVVKSVTGKKRDYSNHYNSRSVRKSKSFLKKYLDKLKKAEQIYGVPKEVITSVLWVETRHGGYLGKHNIINVFLSTAMANEPQFVENNLRPFKDTYKQDSKEYKEYSDKVIKRSKSKSEWAIEQLVALEKVNDMSPIPITEINGSWAGAFGMSQFLPSSYVSWAVDGNNDGQINLFELDDAIHSVANYLKTNGWGNSKKQKRAAVYHYNHSQAYVDAVLLLAKKIIS